MRGNAFFRAMTTPGLRALARRAPVPRDANATRRAMRLNLAMRSGRPRPEKLFSDAELLGIELPERFIFGDADLCGGPGIGERAASLMPDARLDVPGVGARRS